MSLESINMYFVQLRTNETENEEFNTCATVIRSHINESNIRHIKPSEGFPLIASGQLNKRDVFIFDCFEGEFFKQLQQTPALIVGPRCLLVCLMKNEAIPNGRTPIFTVSMRDLKISASGITPEEKQEISEKVGWMGGYYFQNFGRVITHLVSNTIKSSKYEHATMLGIPVMHVDWIKRVWERSLVHYVSATDEEFDKYRLPVFFGANITCTGLDTAKKNEIMRLVQENGGNYHRAFRSQSVDIVITEKGKTDSEKYQAAIRFKKDVLTTEWIFDSVQKGFALPIKDYQVKSLKVSTPTKQDQSIADFTSTDHTNLSEISRISSAGTSKRSSNDITVNDTIATVMNDTRPNDPTFIAPEPAAKAGGKNLKRDVLKKSMDASVLYRATLEEISPREAKKAGIFLDGCHIFLSGFLPAEKEKLNRVLNTSGATRCDVLNDEVTHIIVGQLNDMDYKAWKNGSLRSTVHIVRLDWLLESIKLKQTASENVYRVSLPNSREPDAPSPSSKKTLRSMNHSFKTPDIPTKKKLFTANSDENAPNDKSRTELDSEMPMPNACSTEIPMEEDEHDLLAQYSQENLIAAAPIAELPPPTITVAPIEAHEMTLAAAGAGLDVGPAADNATAMTCTIDYENLDVFRNLVIYVDKENFPEEFYSQLQRECEAAQGNIVCDTFKDPVDYAIVSFERSVDISTLPVKAKYIVTELYMESCMKENKLVPIEYYHKPIPHTAEAQPLKGLTIVISIYAALERDYIDSLAQLLGAKVNNNYSKKEAPLLICPSPEGAKYEGAMKWKFPVVTSEWLVQCAEQGIKLPLRGYLVGNSPEDFPTPTRLGKSVASAFVGTDATPLRNKRVSELATNTKSTPVVGNLTPDNPNLPDSPHTPSNAYGRAAYSIEFMEKLLADIEDPSDRDCVRRIVEEIRANPTPELERIKRQVCTPINRRLSNTPKGISDFYNTPEFKRRMVEEFDKRWHLPTKKLKPSTPIDQIRKRVLRETCKNLGIPVSDDDDDGDDNQSMRNTNRKETENFENIRRKSTTPAQLTPVHHRSLSRSKLEPRSIFAAQASSENRPSIADDNTFVPNTQDVASKNTSATNAAAHLSLVGKSTIDFDKISFEETEIAAAETSLTNVARRSSAAASAATTSGNFNASSPELKQITDYLREREARRQSKMAAANEMESEEPYLQPFESENFMPETGMVDWVDPIDFEREKRARIRRTMQYQGTPRFSISCSDETKRNDIIEKIHKLGGQVSENLINFDPECTHFICERPNRGEKTLGCIAAGKWVLSLKYIEESFAKDAFVDEELYEWGNVKAINIPEILPEDRGIAQAAHRWRLELGESENPNAGIFSGFRAILNINPKNAVSLENVLKAGKAEVVKATKPYKKSKDAHLATHCFVDAKKTPLSRDDYDYLRKKNVKILSFLFIQSYLMNGSDADVSAHEIKM